ncbi:MULTISPECIES: hypothetical protein [Paraburkholderia]|uniref:hypothetical protein n=1 Tax=Paraburkholderia TaxID=1822464 RepID=UPI00225183F5|nr:MULTISPECIES: hypothetical protein [Paraburkholderia]MCX4161900.1 hypothetical protein [Paraburkholderia megapolitana]MDN7157397.1 hypothetical protein [Paraburkholderia sp. CHISQ3]MDQ6494442.1 hypothetical protein [Paraburkholderia megapolitana]
MKIESQWIFECQPQHVWPHFLHAQMDSSRPLLFWFGIPKPMSCRVLEGVAAVGNTRQCTTDRGTIDQRILQLEPNWLLQYQMQQSTVWCREWVGKLIDTFTLEALDGNRTLVRRTTEFEATGLLKVLRLVGLWAALRQAHAYAAKNWRRLAQDAKIAEGQTASMA